MMSAHITSTWDDHDLKLLLQNIQYGMSGVRRRDIFKPYVIEVAVV